MEAVTAETIKHWDRAARDFNRGRWWHAHEGWEQGWTRLPQPLRAQVQALIQLSAVLHLIERSRPRPALALARRALTLLPDGRRLRGSPRPVVPGTRRALVRLERMLSKPGVPAGLRVPRWVRVLQARVVMPTRPHL